MNDKNKQNPIYTFYSSHNSPLGLLSIPHSGEIIPDEFIPYLTTIGTEHFKDVDFGVDRLVHIERLQESGISVIVAHIHRVCVDLNRNDEISVLNWPENTFGEKLVQMKPSEDVLKLLIAKYHHPYYEMIEAFIQDFYSKNKRPVPFVDLHSMPSKPTQYHLKQKPNQALNRPGFCLSDYLGKTCKKEFIQTFAENLKHISDVKINDPYIGGNITIHVGTLAAQNIQIEINRAIYMNEVSRQFSSESSRLKLRDQITESLIKSFNAVSKI